MLANGSHSDPLRIGDLATALPDASYAGPAPRGKPDPASVPRRTKIP